MKQNVSLPKYSQLNDESLDKFLRVIREISCFEIKNVQYVEYPDLIEPCYIKNVQIIGGNYTGMYLF